MAYSRRALYCDESKIHGSGPFYFGMLDLSPRRAEILAAKLLAVKQAHNCAGEMKWVKVSRTMLPVYIEFVNIFLADPYPRLSIYRVERTPAWDAWATKEEERFFKSYYVALRRQMSGYCRYEIHLDQRSARPWRWRSLQFALNKAAVRDEYTVGKKLVYRVVPEDSHGLVLIQLTDVLLGSFTSDPEATAKKKLREHVLTHGGHRAQWKSVTASTRMKTTDSGGGPRDP